jgi:hypothetical protein
MGLGSKLEHADRFAAYVNELTKVIGHADRGKAVSGLLRCHASYGELKRRSERAPGPNPNSFPISD